MDAQRVICEVCGTRVQPHAHYVVRIDVFADPSVPAVTSDELEETDFDNTLEKLMAQMQHMSADDLQDGVHRRFEYRLCPSCHKQFLTNPLGLPRRRDREGGKN
jgi:hypothetical protein